MFKWLIEKLTSKAATAVAGTAADAAAASATGGVSVLVRILVWCLENPLTVLFIVATVVFASMYGCESYKLGNEQEKVVVLTQTLDDTKAELVKTAAAVETCLKSAETYKTDYSACKDAAAKQQLAYGDLIAIIQTKCVTRQKIDEAVKSAEKQKKTTGTYTASELISIYNDMIKARAAALPKPGGVR